MAVLALSVEQEGGLLAKALQYTEQTLTQGRKLTLPPFFLIPTTAAARVKLKRCYSRLGKRDRDLTL